MYSADLSFLKPFLPKFTITPQEVYTHLERNGYKPYVVNREENEDSSFCIQTEDYKGVVLNCSVTIGVVMYGSDTTQPSAVVMRLRDNSSKTIEGIISRMARTLGKDYIEKEGTGKRMFVWTIDGKTVSLTYDEKKNYLNLTIKMR